MSDRNQSSTVTIPYIYLKDKSGEVPNTFKIILPQTFESLLKSVQHKFMSKFNVGSLFTEDGIEIRSIQQVAPGNTVLVSRNGDLSAIKRLSQNKTGSGSTNLNESYYTPTKKNNSSVHFSENSETKPDRGSTKGGNRSKGSPRHGNKGPQNSDDEYYDYYYDDEEEDLDTDYDEIIDSNEKDVDQDEEEKKEEEISLASISSSVSENISFNFDKALEQIDPSYADFLKKAGRLEQEQTASWFEHSELSIDRSVIGYNDYVSKAREVLASHRFSTTQHLNFAIVGPDLSGKSTFMNILVEQAMITLAALDQRSKSFFYVISPGDLCGPPDQIYKAVVSLTFKYLLWQFPVIKPVISSLEKAFGYILEGYTAKLPKSFVQDSNWSGYAPHIQEILSNLESLWKDETALHPFLVSLLMLPVQIARVFGFTKFITIIDHYDDCAVEVSCITPFNRSEPVQLIDIIGFVAANYDFIVSCRHECNFYQIAPIEREIISTVGIIPNPDDSTEFVVDFGKEKLLLTSKFCGGIGPFIQKWKAIIELDQDGSEEAQEEITEIVFDFLKLCLSNDETELTVKSVKRKSQ